MSRKCDISGTGPLFGNKRSHALNTSKKRWNVNLQNVKISINGKEEMLKISARTLRTLRKKGTITN